MALEESKQLIDHALKLSLIHICDPIEALKWGVACGTATTFSNDLATAEFIKETYQEVEVEKL